MNAQFVVGNNLLQVNLGHVAQAFAMGVAPSGELNEKMLGAGSLYEMPEVGHINRFEKYLPSVLPFSNSINEAIALLHRCFNTLG